MSYKAESLHPYIMNDRIKAASGTGGIGNIPIASADTVGGIMIGGSANPITITGSGNASVRKATSELLGVIKAGDGVSIDAEGAISGVPYSTTEYKTGRKWIDGKDIYQKVVSLDSPLTVSSSSSDTGIAPFHDTMIDVKGNAPNGACINFMEFVRDSTIHLACSNDFAVNNIIFTFTKTV